MGTLAGGIVYFFLGFLVYGILLQSFYEANTGSATGVMRLDDEMQWWALILGNLAYAGFITYVWLKWAHISTFKSGFKGGAAMGFLLVLGSNLIMYGVTNLSNLTATLVEIVVATVLTAIIGGVVGAVLHARPQQQPAAA